MKSSIYKINIEEFLNKDMHRKAADLLCNNNIIVITGVSTVSIIRESSESYYDYSVFDINAQWDENEAVYNEAEFRDGGICEGGDALDAINHLVEMINHEEGKG